MISVYLLLDCAVWCWKRDANTHSVDFLYRSKTNRLPDRIVASEFLSYSLSRCALQVIYSRPQVARLAAGGSSTRGRR